MGIQIDRLRNWNEIHVDLSAALQHLTDSIILILYCVECKCLTSIKIALLLFEEIWAGSNDPWDRRLLLEIRELQWWTWAANPPWPPWRPPLLVNISKIWGQKGKSYCYLMLNFNEYINKHIIILTRKIHLLLKTLLAVPPLVPVWVVWVSVWLQCTATLYTQPEDFYHFIAFQSIESSVDSGRDGLISKVSTKW